MNVLKSIKDTFEIYFFFVKERQHANFNVSKNLTSHPNQRQCFKKSVIIN